MRFYLIIKETIGKEREIQVLKNTDDSKEALESLISFSNEWEESIIAGKCRVLMSTYEE